MIKKIRALWERYREIIVYVFFGGLTTLVDFGSYYLFSYLLGVGGDAANLLSQLKMMNAEDKFE